MVKQYPYFLYVFLGVDAYQDANGDWQEGSSEWQFISKCRDETNTKANQITLEDSTQYVFESLIQLPKNAQAVPVDVKVEVRDSENNVRVSGISKRYSKDQLHNRLWL